jgi:hypothetical protein
VTLVIGIDAVPGHNSREELDEALRIIYPWDAPDDNTPIQEKINALSGLLTRMQLACMQLLHPLKVIWHLYIKKRDKIQIPFFCFCQPSAKQQLSA